MMMLAGIFGLVVLFFTLAVTFLMDIRKSINQAEESEPGETQ
jgi:hypothetical protein